MFDNDLFICYCYIICTLLGDALCYKITNIVLKLSIRAYFTHIYCRVCLFAYSVSALSIFLNLKCVVGCKTKY